MKNIFGGVSCLVAMANLVSSCSEPEGGFVEPTPTEVVKYADHVVFGEVTEILGSDTSLGDSYGDGAYNAMVTVHCTYKGGELPRRIKIGAAGYVPGMCFAKDLYKGKQYILFLYEKNTQLDWFEQSEVAVNTSLADYLAVCGLHRSFPSDVGMAPNKDFCPDITPAASCNSPSEAKPNNNPTAADPNQTPNDTPTNMQDVKTGKSTSDDGNAASMVTTISVSTILFSFLCYMML